MLLILLSLNVRKAFPGAQGWGRIGAGPGPDVIADITTFFFFLVYCYM